MHRPELLILDEPTSGLDPLVQREFLAMVREAREAGQSVLLSSHILTEIQHTADDVAVLAGGKGTRFWPVGRAPRPQQVPPLDGDAPRPPGRHGP